MRNRLL